MVQCLISIEGINLNAVNKAGETALDIAEKSGSPQLISILKEAGATHSKDYGRPPTAAEVRKIAQNVKKFHISGLNNAINYATVVAVLITTVAFAAIFTVPGQFVEEKIDGISLGEAHIARKASFVIFVLFDSMALFISIAVVVVQTSVVVIEQKVLSYMGRPPYSGPDSSIRLEDSRMRSIRRAETHSRSYLMSVASHTEVYSENYKRMYICSIGVNKSQINFCTGHQTWNSVDSTRSEYMQWVLSPQV
ncbi:hypothetical protein HAX54_033251 [Datura stramonium]|uniref:PGG domain-containing protein n=1 Tax=Datura stramonium TaxID=4076 RepID=A0ABS8VC17_DATST|nr:hypothetical protein [Datura stramonium]